MEDHNEIPRRAVIKSAIASLALPFSPRSVERPQIGSVAILDFYNIDKFTERERQKHPESRNLDTGSELQSMGVTDDTTLEGLQQGYPQNEGQTFILLTKALETYYKGHGEAVASVREKASGLLGNTKHEASQTSVAEAITFAEITYDDLQNPTLWMDISDKYIEDVIAGSSAEVVSMSLQLGKVGFSYHMNQKRFLHPEISMSVPQKRETIVNGSTVTQYEYRGQYITKAEFEVLMEQMEEFVIEPCAEQDRYFQPIDGYLESTAYENLKKAAQLAGKFPGKTIVAAAGNPSGYQKKDRPDTIEARKRLIREKKWRENLLLAGVYFESEDLSTPTAFGADLYVSSKDLRYIFDKPAASSFATPIVAELVSQSRMKGFLHPSVIRRNILLNAKNVQEYGIKLINCFKKSRLQRK